MRGLHSFAGLVFGVVVLLQTFTATPIAAPSVTGATTRVYAVVTDPVSLAFASDGTLFVGRDASGSGGDAGAAVKIHRVAAGGTSVTQFGDKAIYDPDAVIVDRQGYISGTVGAVLVGGDHVPAGQNGHISMVTPNGNVSLLFGPTTDFINPTDFTFVATNRLLFTAYNSDKIMQTDGSWPTRFAAFPPGKPCAIETDSRNYVWVSSDSSPFISTFDASGSLLSTNFARASKGAPLARGHGGVWGRDMYSVGEGGALIRIDLAGKSTVMGAGFGDTQLEFFGVTLYVSDFAADRVYAITPKPQPGVCLVVR